MSWNYRVVKRTEKLPHFAEPIVTYAIHEVYYDENGDVVNISEEPRPIISDDLFGLYDTITSIQHCLNEKMIIYETGEEEI